MHEEMSEIVVIKDNNNFAPSFLQSLCEIGGDCLVSTYFSSGPVLPQKNT